MQFTATWFSGETAIASKADSNYAAVREIARSRMPVHKVRSGATHVEVRSDDGALLFDSRNGMGSSCGRQPTVVLEELAEA